MIDRLCEKAEEIERGIAFAREQIAKGEAKLELINELITEEEEKAVAPNPNNINGVI